MDGITGKIAYVDLTNERSTCEQVTDKDFVKFLGGRGLAANVLLRSVAAGIDPLSPENALIFATGPITGTNVQGSDRTCIAARGELTGRNLSL
jgi:aldehyde:ferredoxin oxidoreductase